MPSDRPSGLATPPRQAPPGRGVAGGFLRPTLGSWCAADRLGPLRPCRHRRGGHNGARALSMLTQVRYHRSAGDRHRLRFTARGTAVSPVLSGGREFYAVAPSGQCGITAHYLGGDAGTSAAVQPASPTIASTGHRHCAAQEGVSGCPVALRRFPTRGSDISRAAASMSIAGREGPTAACTQLCGSWCSPLVKNDLALISPLSAAVGPTTSSGGLSHLVAVTGESGSRSGLHRKATSTASPGGDPIRRAIAMGFPESGTSRTSRS